MAIGLNDPKIETAKVGASPEAAALIDAEVEKIRASGLDRLQNMTAEDLETEGTQGQGASDIQRLLGEQGFPVKEDGVIGDETRSAFQSFKEHQGDLELDAGATELDSLIDMAEGDDQLLDPIKQLGNLVTDTSKVTVSLKPSGEKRFILNSLGAESEVADDEPDTAIKITQDDTLGDNDEKRLLENETVKAEINAEAEIANKALAIVQDKTISVEQRILRAQAELTHKAPTKTLGGIYAKKEFRNIDADLQTDLGHEIDKRQRREDNNRLAVHSFEGVSGDYEEFMDKPRTWMAEVLPDVITFIAEGYNTLSSGAKFVVGTEIPGLKQTIGKVLDDILTAENDPLLARDIKPGLQRLRDLGIPIDDIRKGGKVVQDYMAGELSSGFKAFQELHAPGTNGTIRDLAKVLSFAPINPEVEPDIARLFQKIVNADFEGDFFDERFSNEMEARHGKNWGMHMAAFMVKEGFVDIGLFILALKRPGIKRYILAQDVEVSPGQFVKASFKARFEAAIYRSILIPIGSAPIAVMMNKIADQDAQWKAEFWLRVGAGFAAEGAFAVARPVLKTVVAKPLGFAYDRVFGRMTIAMAEKLGLGVFDRTIPNTLRNVFKPTKPTGRILYDAQLHAWTKDYFNLQDKIATRLITPEMKTLQDDIFDLTGIKPEDQAVKLGLGRYIWQGDRFKNVGKGPIYEKAIETLKRSEKALAKAGIILNTAQGKVGRARFNFDKITVKTEAEELAHAAKLEELTTNVTHARARYNELTKQVDAEESTIKEMGDPSTFSFGGLPDAIILGHANFSARQALATSQRDVSDIAFTHFDDTLDTVQFKTPSLRETTKGDIVATGMHVTEAAKLGVRGVGEAYFHAMLLADRYGAAMEKMYRSIFMKISRRSRKKVVHALEQGSDREVAFTPLELKAEFDMTPEQIGAYLDARFMLNMSHFIKDAALTKEAIMKGVKMYGDIPVNVTKTKTKGLTDEMIKQGFVRIRAVPFSKNPVQKPIDEIVKAADLKPVKSMIPYQKGYLPIAYDVGRGSGFHVSVIGKDASVKRLAVFPKLRQAIKYLREEGPKRKGEVLFMNRYNQREETSILGFLTAGDRLVDILKENTIDKLRVALAETGISESQLTRIIDEQTRMGMARTFVGTRGGERLLGPGGKPAPLKPTEEAVLDTVVHSARTAGTSEFRVWLIETFKEMYKDILDPNVAWSNKEAIRAIAGADPIRQWEAKEMQRWMLRILSGKTKHEKYFEQGLVHIENALSNGGPVGRATMNTLDVMQDNLMKIGSFGAMRGTVAWAKLLGFVPAQFYVQGSQALLNAGANPRRVFAGAKDALLLLAALEAKRLGVETTIGKEAKQLLAAADRSAYFKNLSTVDAFQLAKVVDKGGTRKGINVLKRGAQTPFRGGEATNRALAWTTSRQVLINEFKKKRLLGLDDTPFRGKIDDDEFIRLVTDRASELALKMTKANQLELGSGGGSVIFQFAQVLPKTINILRSDLIPTGSKLGVTALLMALWGVDGIPGLTTVIDLTEKIAFWASGSNPSRLHIIQEAGRELMMIGSEYINQDKDFLQKLRLSEGALVAISGGDINMVNRVATGKMVTEMTTTVSAEEMIPWVSVFVDLIDLANKTGFNVVNALGLMEAGYALLMEQQGKVPAGTYKKVFTDLTSGFIPDALTGEISWAQAGSRWLSEAGEVASGLAGPAKVLDSTLRNYVDDGYRINDPEERPTLRTAEGTDTGLVASSNELISILIGITPGRLIDTFNVIKLQREYRDAAEEYIKTNVKKALLEANQKRAMDILNSTLDDIREAEDQLISRNIVPGFRDDLANQIWNEYIIGLTRKNSGSSPFIKPR